MLAFPSPGVACTEPGCVPGQFSAVNVAVATKSHVVGYVFYM